MERGVRTSALSAERWGCFKVASGRTVPAVPHPKPRPISKKERAFLFDIGRRIAELRMAAGLTQETLSERFGSTPGRLREIESGRHNPSIVSLSRVAEGLGVELVELFQPPASRVRPGPGRPPKAPPVIQEPPPKKRSARR